MNFTVRKLDLNNAVKEKRCRTGSNVEKGKNILDREKSVGKCLER